MSNVKVVHETDIGTGLEIAGGKLKAAETLATDAEVAAAIAAQDTAENAAEATAKLRSEFCRRGQQVLSTSAVIECTAWGIKFKPDSGNTGVASRILLMGAGDGTHAVEGGYFAIQPPAVGTTIYGMGVPDKVVDADGFIPIAVAHRTLWYKLPAAGAGASTQGTWHYSVYDGASYDVPEDYIFIAQGQPNIAGGVYILYDGRHLVMGDNYTDTSWQDLAPHFGAGISNYGGGYQTARFRRQGNRVFLEGLLKLTTLESQTLATLPVGYRPNAQRIFTSNQDAATPVRVDVKTDGAIVNVKAATEGWIPLDGISFDLA